MISHTSVATSMDDGIYTPIPTLFKADNLLDLESQITHAKKLYGAGVNGLVVSGSMGESIHMKQAERLLLLSEIRKAIPDKKFKLIAGIPPTNIEDAIEEISKAYDAGADYMIILTPGYYGTGLTRQDGIVDYFLTIADKLALPFIIYNFPGVCNAVDLSMESYQKLLAHPAIVGVKLTHSNMDKYIMLAGQKEENQANNFKPFTGLGQVLVPSMAVGAHGAIDGLSGVFPKSMVKLFALYKQEKFREAEQLQLLVTRANQFTYEYNLVGIKYLLKKYYGIGEGRGRAPLNYWLDEKDWSKHEEAVEALYKYEQSMR